MSEGVLGSSARARNEGFLPAAAAVALTVELRNPVRTPIYQSMAPRALELHDRGVSLGAIARLFGVAHHTVTKALRWLGER